MIRRAPTAASAFAIVVAACALAISVAGCGGDSLNRREVFGAVTLDGQSLPQGSIRFEPQGGAPQVAGGAVIQNGKFRIASGQGLVPGKYKVAVSASEKSTSPPSMENTAPPPKDLIPARYNTNTELTAEVVAGGKNEFNFALVSQGTVK